MLVLAAPLCAQQPAGSFYWADFHAPKDQSVVAWVRRSLDAEKWTAIREIGVQYDAALVVTNFRANPQSLPGSDTFTVWSASLTTHSITPVLTGIDLRWIGWMNFTGGQPLELGILYNDCSACEATTYFTALHYDFSRHMWAARWMRGAEGVPVWSEHTPPGMDWTQIYGVLASDNGRELLATWDHFEYGSGKPAEDFLYQYDVDLFSGLDRTQRLTGTAAEAMKLRLCGAQGTESGLDRGQNSALCRRILKPRGQRRPVTTPPADNQG
ncbi:MAG: hypothetical protein ACP5FH_10990, partial [Terracidiphilus sp.]